MRSESRRRNPKCLAGCRMKEKLLVSTVTQMPESTGGLLATLNCEFMGLIIDQTLPMRMIQTLIPWWHHAHLVRNSFHMLTFQFLH